MPNQKQMEMFESEDSNGAKDNIPRKDPKTIFNTGLPPLVGHSAHDLKEDTWAEPATTHKIDLAMSKSAEEARKEIEGRFPSRRVTKEYEGLKKLAAREAINHPPHYNNGNIEVIDAIEDWGLDFNTGNVVKYIARHQHKTDPLEDLKKARWYLDRIIEGYEDASNENQ